MVQVIMTHISHFTPGLRSFPTSVYRVCRLQVLHFPFVFPFVVSLLPAWDWPIQKHLPSSSVYSWNINVKTQWKLFWSILFRFQMQRLTSKNLLVYILLCMSFFILGWHLQTYSSIISGQIVSKVRLVMAFLKKSNEFNDFTVMWM